MSIKSLLLTAFLIVPICLSSAVAVPSDAPKATNAAHDGAQDFAFLDGHWKVHNRRLAKRLAGSHEWIEFDAKDEFNALPGGIGQEEHYRTDFWPDYVGIGLHLYDREHQQWALYWADNRNLPGVLQPPVRGAFVDGVGTFDGDDTFDGKPIKVRFLWKPLSAKAVRWEQAFSPDGGVTWETNWTMDFTR